MRTEVKAAPNYDSYLMLGILASVGFVLIGGKFFVPYGATLGMMAIFWWFAVVE